MTLMRTATFTGLAGIPEVTPGCDLPGLILAAVDRAGLELADGDVLVISAKIVSKALGLQAQARHRALAIAAHTTAVVAERRTPEGLSRVVRSAAGPVLAAAGVNSANSGPEDLVLMLPVDPDGAAAELRDAILAAWALSHAGAPLAVGAGGAAGDAARPPQIAVIISDTSARAWRTGQVDQAIGAAGFATLEDLTGRQDADLRPLPAGARALADEVAAAADLVKGPAQGIPVAHVRGLAEYVGHTQPARALVRTGRSDWFSLGAVEAVRAALGVPPGSPAAEAAGIPSLNGTEDFAERVRRALRVAQSGVPESGMATMSLTVSDDRSALVTLTTPGAKDSLSSDEAPEAEEGGEGPDPFASGVAVGLLAARAAVALAGEGLASESSIEHSPDATTLVIGVREAHLPPRST